VSDPDPKAKPRPTPQEARRQRLAQALRDNLRRRKAGRDIAAPVSDES
jgi:hypothetical protein